MHLDLSGIVFGLATVLLLAIGIVFLVIAIIGGSTTAKHWRTSISRAPMFQFIWAAIPLIVLNGAYLLLVSFFHFRFDRGTREWLDILAIPYCLIFLTITIIVIVKRYRICKRDALQQMAIANGEVPRYL